jgi:hypothetical protein
MANLFLNITVATAAFLLALLTYYLVILPKFNPLQRLAGPPTRGWFDNYLQVILE